MRAAATRIDTLLYTTEARASRAQAEADLAAADPNPERATAILRGASPAPVRTTATRGEESNDGQEVPAGVRPQDG
jgi:hypothetical protein